MAALSSIDFLSSEFNLKLSLGDFEDECSWIEVGRGGFSTVYEAPCKKLDEKVALKKLTKDIRKEEIEILTKTLTHKNIVDIKGFIEPNNANGSLCIAMKMYPTDLQKFRDNLPHPERVWPDISSIILGICSGLKYLYSVGFHHRDIKPQNVLLTETFEPKVGDFGLAKLVGASACTKGTKDRIAMPSGTLDYMSPQLLKNPGKEFTEQDDVYSFALLVYKFITNAILFNPEANEENEANDQPPLTEKTKCTLLRMWVYESRWRHPLPELDKFLTPEYIKDVIDKGWQHEPSDRKNFEEWTNILQKEFEKYSDQDKSQSRKDLSKMVKNIMGGMEDSSPEYLVTDDYGILNNLSKLLDIDDPLDRDWRMLADELGFTANQINLFEQKKNPTKSVLIAASQSGLKITAEMLIKHLKELGRDDAASLVQDWQNNGNRLVDHVNTYDQTDTVTSVFTIQHYRVYKKLKPLDSENVLGNDYRELGDILGIGVTEIQNIAQKSKNKTEAVLNLACQRGKLNSYDHLIRILKDMQRFDMANEIEILQASGSLD